MEARRTKRRDRNQATVVFPNTITTSTPFESEMRLTLSGSEHSLSPISSTRSSNASQNSNSSHTNTLSFINMQNQVKSKRNPSTLDMICKAIEALGSDKSGSSVPAIKKWILGNYTDLIESRLQVQLKKALLKGLIEGSLVRPPRSKSAPGATGSFCLPQKDATKNAIALKKKTKNLATKAKNVSKEKPEEYVSDTEMTINRSRTKSIRLNMSDTELDVVRKSIVFEENPKRGKKAGLSKKVAKENIDADSEPKKPVSKSKMPVVKNVEEKIAPAKPPRRTRDVASANKGDIASANKENIASANKENAAPTKQKSKTGASKEAANAKDANPKDAKLTNAKAAKLANKKEAKVANTKDDKKQAHKRIHRKT